MSYTHLDIERPSAARAAPHGPQEYRGNGKHEWENVGDTYPYTKRLRVPGGWLYRILGESAVFVPVPNAVGYAV